MLPRETFDAIIIGSGQAGPPLAARLTAAGKSVALIEQDVFGGTCVNVGCMPTKTLVASAAVAHHIRRAAEFGIHVAGPISVDMAAVMKRKNAIVRKPDIAVHIDCSSGARQIVGSHVLLASGRRPNTSDLGAAEAGILLDARGFIVVDDQLRTNVPGIWALGDCNGRGAFTHTSYNDFEIVAGNILDGESRRVTDRIACYGLFIDPPLGRVGLTEREARATGRDVRVATRPMTRVGRAIENAETQGFMKVIVDAGTDRIMGAAILGPGGDEAVHGVLDTMSAGVSYRILRRTMHIHPTVSELIPTVLGELAAAAGSATP